MILVKSFPTKNLCYLIFLTNLTILLEYGILKKWRAKINVRKDVKYKMKNSESGLKLTQLIVILCISVILATSINLVNVKGKEVAINKKEEVQEIQEAQEKIVEEEQTVTARSAQERTLENKKQYIPVEEIKISKDMDLTKRCGVSREDFINLMKNLKVDYSGFFGKNAGTIYDLCEKYELNEVFFCGLIAAESGWNIASNHKNTHNYISMMSSKGLIKYSSDEEGLEAATKLLHNKYLTKGGSCYYGKTLSCVQKRFCPNSSTWVGLVYGCMKQVIK